MGDKTHSYYLKVEEIGGMEAKAKLSILTTSNSHEAKTISDSDNTIEIFEKAMKRLVKEFNMHKGESSIRLKLFSLLLSI